MNSFIEEHTFELVVIPFLLAALMLIQIWT